MPPTKSRKISPKLSSGRDKYGTHAARTSRLRDKTGSELGGYHHVRLLVTDISDSCLHCLRADERPLRILNYSLQNPQNPPASGASTVYEALRGAPTAREFFRAPKGRVCCAGRGYIGYHGAPPLPRSIFKAEYVSIAPRQVREQCSKGWRRKTILPSDRPLR